MNDAAEVRSISSDQPDFFAALHQALRVPPLASTIPAPEAQDLLLAAQVGQLRLGPALVHDHDIVVLPIQSPGAAALLLLSAAPRNSPCAAMTACLQRAAALGQSTGCKLLEVLLDPHDADETGWMKPLENAGFHFLTRLVYLSQQQFATQRKPKLSSPVEWVSFTAHSESLFITALEESYQGTQDCPELTGLRTTADVLAGHRATGEFNPDFWSVAARNERPVGVVLLNPLRGGAAEITYLGVAQVARKSGVADALVARAMDWCQQSSATVLALAVDQRNTPALRLYDRWGFTLFQHRDAWIATCAQVAMGTDVGNS